MRLILLPLLLLPAIAFSQEGYVPLFDGKSLDGWVSARSLAGEKSHFSVNAEQQVIHVYAGEEADSEQVTDCLNTTKEYSHFILKMEYKWLEKRFAPRTDWDRDAGLLFHVHGDLKKIWPLSMEMQIGESPGDKANGKPPEGRFHSGDLFVIGRDLLFCDTRRDGDGEGLDSFYDPKGKLVNGGHCPTRLGKEVPKAFDDPNAGWNEMEIRVHGAEKAVFIFNGEVVLELSNMTRLNEAGERVPLDKGRIGLQAEWAEILYRNIRIKEFKPGEVPEVVEVKVGKPEPLYTKVEPHRDGIGKVFLGREISHIMGHQAAGWLERPSREREERTDLAVKALKLKPGEIVADIGCGTGYYAWRMAKEMGPTGRVVGVEIQQEMLDLLASHMKHLGVKNVMGHMGEPDNPKLPPESCDLIIMVDVYHEFEFPYEMTRHMIKSLKPGGRLVFIEYRMEDPKVRIKLCHKMSEAQVRKEMSIHPELEWVETFGELPQQHLITFRKKVK